jgi:hypothetical protein
MWRGIGTASRVSSVLSLPTLLLVVLMSTPLHMRPIAHVVCALYLPALVVVILKGTNEVAMCVKEALDLLWSAVTPCRRWLRCMSCLLIPTSVTPPLVAARLLRGYEAFAVRDGASTTPRVLVLRTRRPVSLLRTTFSARHVKRTTMPRNLWRRMGEEANLYGIDQRSGMCSLVSDLRRSEEIRSRGEHARAKVG